MKVFCFIFLLFLSFNAFSFENYQTFLKLRQKVYEKKFSGFSEFPILHVLDRNKRQLEFKQAQKELKEFIKDKSKFSDFENLMIQSVMNLDIDSDYSSYSNNTGIEGDYYKTPFGIKISVGCFEQVERALRSKQLSYSEIDSHSLEEFIYGMYSEKTKELGIMNVENKILEQLGTSINKMSSCSKNYPSIKPYIKKWMASLKKTTIHCRKSLAATSGILGTAIPDYIPLLMNKTLYLPPESFLSFVGQSSSSLDSFSESRNTFIHEVLHLSFADNKKANRHNNPEIDEVSLSCQSVDRLSDRVYFISNLCTGKTFNTDDESEYLNPNINYSFDEVMANKINKCGIRSACLQHFNDPVFCRELKQMGDCKSKLRTNLKIPESTQRILRNLYEKLEHYVDHCLKENKGKRISGCPSRKYLERPSNMPIKRLFRNFSLKDTNRVKMDLLDFESITFFSNHPKMKVFLSNHEWDLLKEFLFSRSESGLTKQCREQINFQRILKRDSHSCK